MKSNMSVENAVEEHVWTDEEKEHLINEVRNHPCIWDQRLNAHKDRKVVENAWKEIAEILSIECKLSQFCNEGLYMRLIFSNGLRLPPYFFSYRSHIVCIITKSAHLNVVRCTVATQKIIKSAHFRH